MSESQDILKEEFQDEEYRHAYAEDFLNTSVATQIRVLREQRGWTQEDFAQRIGTKQAGVSRLENVNHSSWKTETLHKIARACDVRVRITFETFGTLLDEAEDFSRKALERPSFAEDPAFCKSVEPPVSWHSPPEATSLLARIREAPAQPLRTVLPRGAAQQQALRDQTEEHVLGSASCAPLIDFDEERRKRSSAGMATRDGHRDARGNLPARLTAINQSAIL